MISPKFIKALIIDLVIITIVLAVTFAYNGMTNLFTIMNILPFLMLYAIIHTTFEYVGIG